MTMRWLTGLLFLGVATSSPLPRSRPSPETGTAPALCTVLRSVDRPEAAIVTVRGTYYGGFELSSLACGGCEAAGRVWVNFERDAMPEALGARWQSFKPAVVANVIVVGRLSSKKGHFGHMGEYKHQLDVSRVLTVEMLRSLDQEVADLDAKVCK
jgi:hypothetical protein